IVASVLVSIQGVCESQRNFTDRSANEALGGLGNVPREGKFFGENVGGATWEKSERNAMAILLVRKAVDDFIECTVAAASDDELTAVFSGTHGDFRGVAWAGCFGKVGFDAASGQNLARLV